MMKFMPLMFMVFYYSYLRAHSRSYSTVNALFQIGQQLVINKMKDAPEACATTPSGGRNVKNVTDRSGSRTKGAES